MASNTAPTASATFDALANYPVTWDERTQAWELHDMVTGEIVSFVSERAARTARAYVLTLPGTVVPMDAPGRILPGWASVTAVGSDLPRGHA
ncbi:hypothetical protein [Streptomyces sp. AC495_CC817]|uniref:hypothetical protein n=1 Tax=Streptomyces sp. AC495_CC817 TaxID=2823900 RepID=UPI001C275469|nr:hypothetical protein [Streptomyces sp. AC495_CC817]